MLLGSLSGLSGLAMLLFPRVMAGIYGFPSRAGLVQALGARDLWISGMLFGSHRRSGLAARVFSDLADFVLIAHEAHAARRSGSLTSLRLLGALAGSGVAGVALLYDHAFARHPSYSRLAPSRAVAAMR